MTLSMPRVRAAILAVVLFGAAAGLARAHGDPGSETLANADVYYPASLSGRAANKLTSIVRAANDAGYPIKAAVIPARADLGELAFLWRKPQSYARYLGDDLAYQGRVLTAMPIGFGLSGGSKTDARLLAGLRTGSTAEDLAQASAVAVKRLAQSAGYRVAPSRRDSSSDNRLAIALGGVGILALLALLTYFYLPRAVKRHRD